MNFNAAEILMGAAVAALALLLASGGFFTFRFLSLLRQSRIVCSGKIGDVESIRLTTIRGASRLFAMIWSRQVVKLEDRRIAQCAVALRVIHVAYISLFSSLLLAFSMVVTRGH